MSKYCVSVEFENLDVAVKAAELMSCAFPMLTFQFSEVPELDLDFSKINDPFYFDVTTGVSNGKN